MTFQLDIIDTRRHIYSGDAKSLTIPALGGEMTVLSRHMPVVTPVTLGEVVVETANETLTFTIGKGIFSMDKNAASLLVEDAMYTDEISEAEAEKARQKAKEIIEKGVKGPDLEAALATVRRINLDLEHVRKRRKVRV